ncbi:MAG: VanZ family protein [Sinobacterium sp.]|nr:VanZ family protein [Sinobacterium sp.]
MLILARLALLAYISTLIALSLANLSSNNIPPIMMFDKILHLGAYFTLGIISFFASASRTQYKLLLALGFILGIALEIAQATLTDYRGGDVADQVANTLGLLVSFQLCSLPPIKKWRAKQST